MHEPQRKTPANRHYRTCRRQAGLTVSDVAAVLGCNGYEAISRIERNHRKPNLDIVIGYHLLFDIPMKQLLRDELDAYSGVIRERVKLRVEELRTQPQTPFVRSRIVQLERFIK